MGIPKKMPRKVSAVLALDLVDPTSRTFYVHQDLGMFSTHVGDTCLLSFHLDEVQHGRLMPLAWIRGKQPRPKP
jgi:hypothetical protein